MLKQAKEPKKLQERIGALFVVIPLTPNQWTLLSLFVAAIAAVMIASDNLLFGLMLFAVSALFDFVDGAVARARGEVTELGGFIDGVADRFVEALFLFSFMFYPLPQLFVDSRIWLAVLIFIGTCMPSFVRAYADHKGVLSREKALALGGICERSERLLLLIIGLAVGLIYSMDLFVYSIILTSFLSFITVLQRTMQIINRA